MELFIEDSLDDLKSFIVSNIEEYCNRVDLQTNDFTLPRLKEEQIQTGSFDIDKYTSEVSCFLIPTDMTFEEYSLQDEMVNIPIDIYLTFRKYDHDKLSRIASRYGSIFKTMTDEKYTLDNKVEKINITQIKYVADLFGDDDVKGLHIMSVIEKII